MIYELDLSTLAQLDGGRVLEAWRQELQHVTRDCEDRPGDGKARSVLLQLDLEPVIGEDGELETIKGKFQVRSKVPQRRSKKYDLAVRRRGDRNQRTLVFNDLSDDDFSQMTINEM